METAACLLLSCRFCARHPGPLSPVLGSPQVFRFCRPKCHKAFQKKRNPRKIRWTKAFRRAAGKEMKVDSTFEFEKRRNKPVKYDRELMGATIRAMKRVQQIQKAREDRYFDKRMSLAKEAEKEAAKIEIAEGLDLVKPAVVREKEKEKAVAAVAKEAKKKEKAGGAKAKEGKVKMEVE